MLCLGQFRAATISIMATGPKWSSSTGTNILMVLKQNGWSVLMQAAYCAGVRGMSINCVGISAGLIMNIFPGVTSVSTYCL